MDSAYSENALLDSTRRALGQSWWLLLAQGVLGIVFGILALVWPGATLRVLIALFGLFVLLMGIVRVISAIGSALNGQSWGWRVTSGVLGVLAGVVILRWPGVTALVLLLFIGAWALITGIIEIVGSIAEHNSISGAWLYTLTGALSVLFGILMFAWPSVGLLTVIWLVGIYAVLYGIMLCVAAFRVRGLAKQATAVEAPYRQSGPALS